LGASMSLGGDSFAMPLSAGRRTKVFPGRGRKDRESRTRLEQTTTGRARVLGFKKNWAGTRRQLRRARGSRLRHNLGCGSRRVHFQCWNSRCTLETRGSDFSRTLHIASSNLFWDTFIARMETLQHRPPTRHNE
jgi:hypothetical protein